MFKIGVFIYNWIVLLYKKVYNMLLYECIIIFLGYVFGELEIINECLEFGIW